MNNNYIRVKRSEYDLYKLEQKRVRFIVLSAFVFIACLIVLLGLGIYLHTEKVEALANPIQYGIKKLSKDYNTEASCLLSLNKENYGSVLITSNGTKPINTYSEEQRELPNFNLTFAP